MIISIYFSPTFNFADLALHEALPGHHLQVNVNKLCNGFRGFFNQNNFSSFVFFYYAILPNINMNQYDYNRITDLYIIFTRLLLITVFSSFDLMLKKPYRFSSVLSFT